MKIIFYNFTKCNKRDYGNKALGLLWLHNNGFKIPRSLCISIHRTSSNFLSDLDKEKIKLHIIEHSKNATMIVRSSSLVEDTSTSSLAGYFMTIRNLTNPKSVMSAIEKIFRHAFIMKPELDTMGIIVQPQIYAKYSGVLFTSNPISWERNIGLLSAVHGSGHLLVSGKETGSEYILNPPNIELVNGKAIIPNNLLQLLATYCKEIRLKYKSPADIEWLIDESHKFYFLQIRPITGINTDINKLNTVGENYEDNVNNEKYNLRYQAKKLSIKVSNGWSLIISCESQSNDIERMLSSIRSNADLFSLVLMKPPLSKGKVYRQFCTQNSLSQNLSTLIKKVKSNYLIVECIIKEILKPVYTGMISKTANGYQIEIARGHYLPKGVTKISHYSIDYYKNVIYSREIIQPYYYEISEKEPIKIEFGKKIEFTVEELSEIIRELDPLLCTLESVVEFGVMRNWDIIALDYVKDAIQPCPLERLNGIISKGKRTGVFVKAKHILKDHNSFDYHKKNHLDDRIIGQKQVIIWSELPSLNLMNLIEMFGKDYIGFVFSEFSLLSHFSITLRELGVPAIWYNNDVEKFVSKEVIIDAETARLPMEKRLVVLKNKDEMIN
jgi:hypothetical protein